MAAEYEINYDTVLTAGQLCLEAKKNARLRLQFQLAFSNLKNGKCENKKGLKERVHSRVFCGTTDNSKSNFILLVINCCPVLHVELY
jgi:hypothetical protein